MFTPRFWCQARQLRQIALASLVTALVVLAHPLMTSQGMAQMIPLPGFPPASEPLPANVQRHGQLESAGIYLDGEKLFRIASPAVMNRTEVGDQIPVETRAEQIQANLRRLLITHPDYANSLQLNPETMEVVIETVDGYPVLMVDDVGLFDRRVLLTVTDADADYHGTTREALAQEWADILDGEDGEVGRLSEAIALRQPEAFRQGLMTSAKILTAVIIMTALLGGIRVWLKRREQHLSQRRAAEAALIKAHDAAPGDQPTEQLESRFQEGLHQHLTLERRLHAVRLLRWLLFWGIATVWALGTAYGLQLFPQTRQFARTLVVAPVMVLVVWFVVGLTDRLINLSVDRFMQKVVQGQPLNSTNLQRIHTLAQVIKGVKMVLIYTAGLLWVLQWLNLVPGSVIAIGTLVALLLSFAAQNLVKDLVNGFFILLEDQFRIGDVVMIGDIDGFVENLNLRITQLRNPAGELITIPNSSITHVRNMTRHWSRATVDVEVAYNSDIDLALAVMQETAEAMATDPKWQPLILDTHEFLGVQEISHTGVLIQIWIKTMPLKQWLVAMEFRRRLKFAFDQNNIQIGTPRQVWLQEGNLPPEQPQPMHTINNNK
ncbi:MAG: mechanosensitive ion channel family protein [Leptolyngbya sp. LCM1.Bin17]|nr:MAG: mechanosensitive ion channel family protein [Leptolyngbya sp. LCM1.Bin17]